MWSEVGAFFLLITLVNNCAVCFGAKFVYCMGVSIPQLFTFMNGKTTCNTLKAIRKQIADANGIPYEPVVCNHKGNCLGTCPACEAEVRYIENELARRKKQNGELNIVGVAKNILPSKEMLVKHAAAVAITAAASLSAVSVDACAQDVQSSVPIENVGQRVTVGGCVSDSSEPLPGASVTIKGTEIGVESDENGNFNIDVAIGDTLLFEYLGYSPKEIVVTKEDHDWMVMLVGETFCAAVPPPVSKGDMVGCVTILSEQPILTPSVSEQTGTETFAKSMDLWSRTFQHGKSSLVGENETFTLLDGRPVDAGIGRYSLYSLNSADVESSETRNDGSPMYASRTSGNLFFHSLKKGMNYGSRIEYVGSFSVSQFTKRYNMMNLKQYNDYIKNPQIITDRMVDDAGPAPLNGGADWQDELFRTGVGHSHYLSFRGGRKKAKYDASFVYSKQTGVIHGSDDEQLGGRVYLESKVKDWLNFGGDVRINRHNTNEVANLARPLRPSVSNFKGVDDNVLVQTLLQRPSDTPDNTAGPSNDLGVSMNPIAEVKNSPLKYVETDVNAMSFLEFKFCKDLTWRNELSADITRANESLFLPSYSYDVLERRPEDATLREGTYNSDVARLASALLYSKVFQKNHRTQARLGTVAESYKWSGQMEEDRGVATNALSAVNLAKDTWADYYFDGAAKMLLLDGCLSYEYRRRYYIELGDNYSRASYFGQGSHGEFYPYALAKWRASFEDFIYDNEALNRIFTDVVLTVGYSESGNSHLSQLIYMTNSYKNNPDLKWERNKQTMGKLQLGLWNKVDFGATAFIRKNTDLMVDANAKGSAYGLANRDACYVNAGEIKNTGVELGMFFWNFSTKMFQKYFQWTADCRFTFVRNEVTDLGSFSVVTDRNAPWGSYRVFGRDVEINRTEVGGAPGRFYGYKSEGLILNSAELAEYELATGRKARVGDMRYSAEKSYIGDPNPDFIYNVGSYWQWGSWRLSLCLMGSYGNDVYNLVRQRIESQTAGNSYYNLLASCANFARVETDASGSAYVVNAGTTVPRSEYSNGADNSSNVVSDRYVEDGSYLRIQNLSLTYMFNEICKNYSCKKYLEGAYVRFGVENLHTFTKYKGYDPENPGCAIRQGVDEGRYPSPRTYRLSAGFKL